jgi:predicted transposase/invertase (TIGR01784 family)
MSAEELEIQTKRQIFIQDQLGALSLATKQGIELGKQEEKLEIARNLLDVLDDATIALKTGLTLEQIQALRN